MMNSKDIDERNRLLVALIKELDLGIHIVGFPEKMKFISADYKHWYSGYVKNFDVILKPQEFTEEESYRVRLRPIELLNIDSIRGEFENWIGYAKHKRIYTVRQGSSGMFVTGFNHHDKIGKTSPYPVFARFEPVIYNDALKAQEIVNRFSEYELHFL